MSILQPINALANPEIQMNENFETLSCFAVYGKDPRYTENLTWVYYGGVWGGFAITGGIANAITLTNTAINYLVVAKATGVLSASTSITNWNDATNYSRVYLLTTAGGVVTATADHRAGSLGIFALVGGVGDVLKTGSNMTGGINEALSTVASATTPDIFALTVGNKINYTGTATCTGFVAAPQAGASRTLICAGAAVFTAGANLLIQGVASGQNFTAVAGDAIEVFAVTTTQFRMRALGTMATQNAGSYSGKNLIINGGFTVNQRGYVSAAVLASGAYGHDRFKAGVGGGDYSFTQLASNTTITIAANKTLIQVVEDKNVQGASYVLSWTGTALARYAVNSATPAGAYAASPILITGQTAGSTMSVEFGNGASTGTLGNVQLEVGAAATTYENRSYGAELILCQRYLPAFGSGVGTLALGYSTGDTTGYAFPLFKVTPRVPPTGLTYSSLAHFNIYVAGSVAPTSMVFNSASSDGAFLILGAASGLGATSRLALNLDCLSTSGKLLFTGCEL